MQDLFMNSIMQFVDQKVLVLIFVIYALGLFIKRLEMIADKFIPFILLIIGIAFSIAILGITVEAVIQGILVAAIAVFFNQLIKQTKKK